MVYMYIDPNLYMHIHILLQSVAKSLQYYSLNSCLPHQKLIETGIGKYLQNQDDRMD